MRSNSNRTLLSRLAFCSCLAALASMSFVFTPLCPDASAQPNAAPDASEDDAGNVDGVDGEGDANEPVDTEEVGAEIEPTSTAPEAEDISSLRDEYLKLRDRLFQSQARASAVASALYSTRLAVKLDYKSARYYTITRATIRLDGASIYDDTSGAIGSDDASRFEGYIAPGRHQLSVRIEASGKDDERFTSVIDNSFIVQASKDKDLEVSISAEDGGDMAYSWAKKERGSYNLQMKVKVKTLKRGAKASKGLRSEKKQSVRANGRG